jgi:hypothetical protein
MDQHNNENNQTQQAFAIVVKAAELYVNNLDDLAKALVAPQLEAAVKHLSAELSKPKVVPAETPEAE